MWLYDMVNSSETNWLCIQCGYRVGLSKSTQVLIKEKSTGFKKVVFVYLNIDHLLIIHI